MTYHDVTFEKICYAVLQNRFKRSAPLDQRQAQYSTDTASCERLHICHKNASDIRPNNGARQTNTMEKRQAQSAAKPGHIYPHLIATQIQPECS